jgi:hypothetical protein
LVIFNIWDRRETDILNVVKYCNVQSRGLDWREVREGGAVRRGGRGGGGAPAIRGNSINPSFQNTQDLSVLPVPSPKVSSLQTCGQSTLRNF